ncbi:alpha/beta hydrolase [Dongia mobilis]|nr:alpha/beta hydrolase [Dongia mobilis]
MASLVSRAEVRPVNKVVAGLILLMAVLAWYQQDAPISGASGGGPHLVATDCWFEPPEGFVVTCHRLPVPETRPLSLRIAGAPAPRDLLLPVVRVHASTVAEGEPKPDPIVYLAGGPGDGAWIDPERIGWWWMQIAANPWMSRRDLILFDQRGSGLVQPRMDCPDATESALAQLSIADSGEAQRAQLDEVRRCSDFVLASGHNAAAYTSVDSAADLHDLFVALDVPRWNVYGLSYGTRLALEYMRAYPDDIRSVILDSVLPPQAQFYEDDAAHTDRAIRYLVEQCAASADCSRSYPELGPRLEKLVERLNGDPILVARPHPGGKGDVMVRMDGERFIFHLHSMLYSRDDIEYLPRLIDAYERRHWVEVNEDLDFYVRSAGDRADFGDAMFASVNCFEEVPFNDLVAADAAYARYRLLRGLERERAWQSYGESCGIWRRAFGVEEVRPSDSAAVVSDLPSLILTGTYDPVTPPGYGRLAAATLSNSHLFEFAHYGHDVLGHDSCANEIAEAFLEAPTAVPDSACLADGQAPRFTGPAR